MCQGKNAYPYGSEEIALYLVCSVCLLISRVREELQGGGDLGKPLSELGTWRLPKDVVGLLVEGFAQRLVLRHCGEDVGARRFRPRGDESGGEGNGVSWCVSVPLV